MDEQAFRRAGIDVSRETFALLECYAALLIKWNKAINLIAPRGIPDLWARHIVDSAQLHGLAPHGVDRWVDLGSGGGLPGIVLAILRRNDPTQFVLVESDRRKATFLRTAIRETGVFAQVLCERAERATPQRADVISARALAPLDDLLAHQLRHGAPGSIGLYPKGVSAEAEILRALERWKFTCEKIPSATSVDSLVLKIGDLCRA